LIESLSARAGFSASENQRIPIDHPEGPLFLEAGPGSGKTRVLLWRVANMIVFHAVEPQSIFLSTFTEKAAKQLQDGLVSLLGLASEQTGRPCDLSGMYVGTVHALCHRLLQDRSFVVDRERSTTPALLDELDQCPMLAQGSFRTAAKSHLTFEGELSAFREALNSSFEAPTSASRHKAVVNLQSLFNRLSEEDLDPRAISEKAPEEHAPLFRLCGLHRERLGKHRVDLSLLQRAAYRALLGNDASMHRFKHVIVDEYQDTNAIQERVFFRLAGGSKNVCVVGDDDQALYRFRGATVENFVDFPRRCQGALGVEPRRIELGINYRSRRGIVQAYTSFVAQHDWNRPGGGQFRLQDKGVHAHSQDDGVSVVCAAPSKPVDLVDEIATLCRRLIDEKVVADPNQIAFLFPTLKSSVVEKFEEALGRVGLRVHAPRAKRFFEAEEPTLIVGLLTRVLGKPPRNEAFDRGEHGEFHSWLDSAATVADALMDGDPTLRSFVDQRVADLSAIRRDYAALKAVLDAGGWSEDGACDPSTHKRSLLNAAGLSADARRALGERALELTSQAHAEIKSVVTALYTEIDHRVPAATSSARTQAMRRAALGSCWDVSFARGRAIRGALCASANMRPLRELASPVSPSLRGLRDDESVVAIQADDVNEATFLVEGAGLRAVSELSSRMRQRLQVGDVLLCTTGDGDQVAFLDDELAHDGHPLLASATFTVLRFSETPRVFAATLRHPLVRAQLRLLSSGSVQRFINKRDLVELLVPVLGTVWREDFEARLTRAMQRRREALLARAALIHAADDYVREGTQ
jgi:DNA helicase II / ATP-dependent DNA helicase PcrA